MSSVRMCDKCGEIFSEREDGWTTASVSQVVEREDGTQRTVSYPVDQCKDCSPDPRALRENMRALRKDAKIRRLELEAGVGDPIEVELDRLEKRHGNLEGP